MIERDCNTCVHHKQGAHPAKVHIVGTVADFYAQFDVPFLRQQGVNVNANCHDCLNSNLKYYKGDE